MKCPDMCLLGVGMRTNTDAARQLMAGGMIGTRRLAVVREAFEQSQDHTHLDCIFNMVGKS